MNCLRKDQPLTCMVTKWRWRIYGIQWVQGLYLSEWEIPGYREWAARERPRSWVLWTNETAVLETYKNLISWTNSRSPDQTRWWQERDSVKSGEYLAHKIWTDVPWWDDVVMGLKVLPRERRIPCEFFLGDHSVFQGMPSWRSDAAEPLFASQILPYRRCHISSQI